MGFLDVAFLSWDSFAPHFSKIVVEVKASGPLNVEKVWLGVSMGMLPVMYFFPQILFLMSVKYHENHNTVAKLR